jgi:hypothetical protein
LFGHQHCHARLSAEKLHELVQWGECHSPIACTVRDASSYAFEVEIV